MSRDDKHARIWRDVIWPKPEPVPEPERKRYFDGEEHVETATEFRDGALRMRVMKKRARIQWEVVSDEWFDALEVTNFGDKERQYVPGYPLGGDD